MVIILHWLQSFQSMKHLVLGLLGILYKIHTSCIEQCFYCGIMDGSQQVYGHRVSEKQVLMHEKGNFDDNKTLCL